jgi:hypothetical protein
MFFQLCERAVRSRVTLRKEGQVELYGETPNGLSASATLPNGDKRCQHYLRVADSKLQRIRPNRLGLAGNGTSSQAISKSGDLLLNFLPDV